MGTRIIIRLLPPKIEMTAHMGTHYIGYDQIRCSLTPTFPNRFENGLQIRNQHAKEHVVSTNSTRNFRTCKMTNSTRNFGNYKPERSRVTLLLEILGTTGTTGTTVLHTILPERSRVSPLVYICVYVLRLRLSSSRAYWHIGRRESSTCRGCLRLSGLHSS